MLLKNSNKYTILVSGASGIVGYGILRSLKEMGNCYLIGTTIYQESPANCFSDIVELLPPTSDPMYIGALKKIIQKHSVNMIIPAIEADMEKWNENRQELEETGVFLLVNNSKLIHACLDKWKFYKILEENNFAGRIRSSINKEFGQFNVPFILKPRCGYGSKGVVKIENREQYDRFVSEIGERLMMQEFVGTDEEEYTVSVFFDTKSNIKAMMGLKRKLSRTGYTEIAKVVETETFLDSIRELSSIFKPVGPTNFQFRRNKEVWKLLEINPRISSSTSIRQKFGYNESKMAVHYFLDGKNIEQPIIQKGSAIRYTEDYIIYDSNNI